MRSAAGGGCGREPKKARRIAPARRPLAAGLDLVRHNPAATLAPSPPMSADHHLLIFRGTEATMTHRVHLGPGSCDGHSLRARMFLAEWLKSEADAAGYDIAVCVDDRVEATDFEPDREAPPPLAAWLRATIARMSRKLDQIADADLAPLTPAMD